MTFDPVAPNPAACRLGREAVFTKQSARLGACQAPFTPLAQHRQLTLAFGDRCLIGDRVGQSFETSSDLTQRSGYLGGTNHNVIVYAIASDCYSDGYSSIASGAWSHAERRDGGCGQARVSGWGSDS